MSSMECDEKSREKPYAPAKMCFFTSMKLLRLPVLLLLYLDIEIGCRPRGYNQITHSCFIRLTSSTTSPVQNRLPERNVYLFVCHVQFSAQGAGFCLQFPNVQDKQALCGSLSTKFRLAAPLYNGELVLNIWKLQTESCTLSGKLHMTDEQINFSV